MSTPLELWEEEILSEARSFYLNATEDDLAVEIDLVSRRLADGEASSVEALSVLANVREALAARSFVGDVAALEARCDALDTAIATAKAAAQAQEAAAQAQKAEQRARAAVAREALAVEAESLTGSTSWKATSERFSSMIDVWTSLPYAERPVEQVAWKRFSAARMQFDSARRAHFAGLAANEGTGVFGQLSGHSRQWPDYSQESDDERGPSYRGPLPSGSESLEKFIGAGGSVAQAVAGAGADFEVAAYLMNGGWSVEDALRDSTGEGMREAFAANLSLETVRSARADGYSLLVVVRLVKWNVDEEVACSIASRVAPENAETVGVLISKYSATVEEALLWGSLSGSVSNNPIFAYRDYDDLFVEPETLYDECSGDGRILDALLARTVDVGTMHDFLEAAGSVVRVGQALDWLESVNASGLEIARDRYESLLRAAASVLGAGLHLDVLEGPLQDGVDLKELANFLEIGDATVAFEQARAALDAGVSLDAFGELLENGWSVEEALFLAPSAAVVMPESHEEYWAREERIDDIREERIDDIREERIDYSLDDMWHPFARHLWEGVPLEEVAARIAAGDEPESPRDRELRERHIQELRDAGASDEHARQLKEAGISADYLKRFLDVRVPEGTPPMTVDDVLFAVLRSKEKEQVAGRHYWEPSFFKCVAGYGVAGTRELLLKADLDVVHQLVRSASLSELLAAVDAGVDLQAVVSFVRQGGTFAQYCDNSMLVVAELSAAELSSAEPTVSDPRRVIPVGARPATVTHAKGCGCVTCR